MYEIKPLGNNVVVKIVEQVEKKEGLIVIPDAHVAESTLAEVMIPPKYSYHPNGDLKDSELETGDFVRIPVGKIGTEMPEAKEGEKWICLPEDCLYYIVKNRSQKND